MPLSFRQLIVAYALMCAASALVPTLAFEMGVTISATCCLWQSNISPLTCSRNRKLSDIAQECVPTQKLQAADAHE